MSSLYDLETDLMVLKEILFTHKKKTPSGINDDPILTLYANITKEIRYNPTFLSLKELRHHKMDIYHHVIKVSYHTFIWSRRLHLDHVSATRAALLHDFFTYDWRLEGQLRKKRLFEKHGFTHPAEALKNAKEHFSVNAIEEDAIVHHMFPLTIKPPRYAESWLVTIIDKYITVIEYFI